MSEPTSLILSSDQALAKPESWYRSQILALKELIAKDCTDQELTLFAKVCKDQGLNPVSRQIYAVQREGKMTVQIGIDGLRLIAQRSGKYRGQTPPQWCGRDGVWREVWIPQEGEDGPFAAKIGVYHADFDRPVEQVARFEAYAQRKRNGDLFKIWGKMPDVMIAKVAEALALRKAFPQETSDLYTEEEMAQASNPLPDSRPVYDPDLNQLPKAEQDSIRKRIWVLAEKVLGRDDKEANLYKTGTAARLIYLNAEGKPSLSVTPKSKLLALIDRLQNAADKMQAESPSNDVKKQEQPPAEEVEEADYTPKEDAPTADTASLKMRLEKLESELSQIDTMEKRKSWYADQFEACEEKMEAAFGEGFADGYLPPWDKKAKRPDWATATNEQLNNWLNWLVDLAAAS